MYSPQVTLATISAGAVYFGALTYVGNAPNFMIKAIAESRGVTMPSFFGYLGYTRRLCCCLPAVRDRIRAWHLFGAAATRESPVSMVNPEHEDVNANRDRARRARSSARCRRCATGRRSG